MSPSSSSPSSLEVDIPRPDGGGSLAGTLDEKCPLDERLVLILHGMMGHRDYVYQRKLAQALPYNSLRIDFHGNGASTGEWDYARFERDVEDIEVVHTWLKTNSRRPYRLWCIVGHSRGAIAACRWIMDHGRDLPYFVPVSCRYRMEKVWDRLPAMKDSFEKEGHFTLKAKVAGKLVEKQVVMEDLEYFAAWDTKRIDTDFPRTCQVFTIHGLADEIVPTHDAAIFSNILSAQNVPHTLLLVPEAGHNFQGKGQRELVVSEIVNWLSPLHRKERFLRMVQMNGIGRLDRWIDVDGVKNVRDLGGWKIPSSPVAWIRERVVFRSAGLSGITPRGRETLKRLGIKTIFDLRSQTEVEHDIPPDLEIERRHVPVFQNHDASPAALAERFLSYGSGFDGFAKVYMNILQAGKGAFRDIFRALVPSRGHVDPILVHCTAGKDRTGVFGMIFLNLMDVTDDLVANEYELTECKEKGFGDGAELIARFVDLEDPDQEEMREKIRFIMSASSASMESALKAFKAHYGPEPARAYLSSCGLSSSEVDSIVRYFSTDAQRHVGWIRSVL